MVTANTQDELMRETIMTSYQSGQTGVKNTVFDIPIPENYALEIHTVDFILATGGGMTGNRVKFFLVDDPDEDADPGHSAQKVIQSTEHRNEFTTQGRALGWGTKSMDCHRTMLVKQPNFITVIDSDPQTTLYGYARIWFKFKKISPREILDLLRQQQY